MTTIRCPACRGAKKLPKLGGMIGECNTCSGKGTILAVDKPQTLIVEPVESNADIIKAVSEVVPVSNVEVLKPVALPEEPMIKVDGKRAIYKRKKASK